MIRLKERGLMTILFLFILTLSITITINAKWLYVWDVEKLGMLDYVMVTKKELLANYGELMKYLNFFWVHPLNMPDFPTSTSGALHFYEVKRLFQINYLVLLLSSLPSFLFVKNLKETGRLWLLIRPFTWLLTGLFVIVLFMLMAFNQFFVLFHEVFFNNDAWVFDPMTDPIITVLPQEYFFHCFILFFVLLVLFLIIGVMLGKKQLNK